MSEPFEFLSNLPPLTPEERTETKRIIAEAKAKGHPLAQYAGIFMDDPTFNEWVEIMRENRRKADEDPDF